MRAAMCVLVLIGCGGGVQYGSFVDGRRDAQAAMAADATKKLATEFAPDEHSLRFEHAVTDAFGQIFEAELRRAGYAIKDSAAPRSRAELQLRYVVDRLKGTELLRVTLYLQRRTLSRPYVERASGLYPVGPWSMGGVHGS